MESTHGRIEIMVFDKLPRWTYVLDGQQAEPYATLYAEHNGWIGAGPDYCSTPGPMCPVGPETIGEAKTRLAWVAEKIADEIIEKNRIIGGRLSAMRLVREAFAAWDARHGFATEPAPEPDQGAAETPIVVHARRS